MFKTTRSNISGLVIIGTLFACAALANCGRTTDGTAASTPVTPPAPVAAAPAPVAPAKPAESSHDRYMRESARLVQDTEKAKNGRMLFETRNAPTVNLSDVDTMAEPCVINGKPARVAAMLPANGGLVLGCYRWQGDNVVVKWAGMDGWQVMNGDEFTKVKN